MKIRLSAIVGVVLVLAAAVPADPMFASLKLASVPDSAFVRIDNVLKGQTPVEVPEIYPGKRVLRVWKAGYHAYVRELTFELGKRQVGSVTLVPLTQAGLDSARRADVSSDRVFPAHYSRSCLKLTTQPDSATVNVAGDPAGSTPLTVGNVIPGKRALSITKYGYRSIEREIDFKADQTVELSFTLEPMTQQQLDSAQAAGEARKARAESLKAVPRDKARDKKAPAGMYKGAEPVVTPQPPYPAEAKADRIEGRVVVALLVDTDGDVIAAEINNSSGDEALDQAARETALQWKFSPAMAPGNKPVRVWLERTFTFKIN